MNKTFKYKKGMSMVELLIVVTIMGLLLAAVLSGVKLLEQAKLNNVLADMQRYKVAFKGYEEYYRYKPGDDPNAGARWGTECAVTAAACSGNGNNSIYPSPMGSYGGLNESIVAWKHLALSKFIDYEIRQYDPSVKPTIGRGKDIPESGITPHAGYVFAGSLREDNVARTGYLFNRTTVLMLAKHRGGFATNNTGSGEFVIPTEGALTGSQMIYLSNKTGGNGVPKDGILRGVDGHDNGGQYKCWSDYTGLSYNDKLGDEKVCMVAFHVDV